MSTANTTATRLITLIMSLQRQHNQKAACSKYADPVHKITIIPHGRAALGYTMQLPTEDRYLMSHSALLDKLKGLLGGRAAEEVVFGEVTTGAENDLEHATALARQMVSMFGMSSVIGLAHCAQRQHTFAGGIPDGVLQRDCSEETAREIDEEVKKLLDNAYASARNLLQEHRTQLDRIAEQLLEQETLDGKTFRQILNSPPLPETAVRRPQEVKLNADRASAPGPAPEDDSSSAAPSNRDGVAAKSG